MSVMAQEDTHCECKDPNHREPCPNEPTEHSGGAGPALCAPCLYGCEFR